jgi:signal transduction histidine kinase
MKLQLASTPFAPRLVGNRLLAALPAAELQRWLPRLEPVELSSGQVLYEPGRAPRHAYFPTTAVVSLLYMTERGESDEVAVVGCEGIVGVSLFMGGRATPTTAVVQRAGQCLRLPAHTLTEEFERSAAVMHVLLAYSLARTVQVAQSAVCNRHHSLEQRLCRRLLQGLDRQQDGELQLTQEQLAGLLGVRRESITVAAHKLQKAGVVRYSRGHILVLDRVALERRACECYAVVKKTFDKLLPANSGASAPNLAADRSGTGRLSAPLLECSPGTTEGNVNAGRRFAPPPPNVGLADLATHLQLMREQERGDLARELHDELGALLTCAKLDVASLKSRLSGASIDTDRRLQHLGEMINLGIAFSRRVVEGLHPSSLTNLGLTASLEILAREFGMNSGIKTETHLEETILDSPRQLALYRVVQESLNNATKYAAATDARIVLLDCGSDIVVTVRDNGKGFDPAAAGAASHGLAGMRHRVESCGGEFTLNSEPGRGTLITAVLPKQTSAAPQRMTLSARDMCVAGG